MLLINSRNKKWEKGKRKDKEGLKLYNLPRLSECLKGKLKRIKLISMMHGLVLLLGLLVKDSTIISKHDFEHDACPNSWKDSNASPKVKTTKEKRIGSRSLTWNILKVEGRVRASRWKLRWVISRSIIPMHSPTEQQVGKCIVGTLLVHG